MAALTSPPFARYPKVPRGGWPGAAGPPDPSDGGRSRGGGTRVVSGQRVGAYGGVAKAGHFLLIGVDLQSQGGLASEKGEIPHDFQQ